LPLRYSLTFISTKKKTAQNNIIEKITIWDFENPDPGLGQAHDVAGFNLIN